MALILFIRCRSSTFLGVLRTSIFVQYRGINLCQPAVFGKIIGRRHHGSENEGKTELDT